MDARVWSRLSITDVIVRFYKMSVSSSDTTSSVPPPTDAIPSSLPALTLEITLLGTKSPKVTRTIQVPLTCTLEQLHGATQDAMGWEDAHLYQFHDGKNLILAHNKKLVVDHLPLQYTYDMGDSWEHSIKQMKDVVEASNSGKSVVYPKILAWTGSCPPEDCGGAWGYAELKNELKLKRAGEPYDTERIEWLEDSSGNFDPETSFVPEKVWFRDLWVDGKFIKNCGFEYM